MQYITTQEAAKRLDLTQEAVRKLIERGALRAEKLGEIWAIDPDSLDGYVRSPRGRPRSLDGRRPN